MAQIGDIIISLEARLANFERGMDRANKQIDGVDRNTKNLSRSFERMEQVASRVGFAMKALALGGVVRSIGNAALAAERITNSLRFATGSAEGAADALKFVREEADRLGLVARVVGQSFSSIAAAAQGTVLEGQAVREIFLGVAEASSALNLTADQTEGALRALEQMMSKGKVQAEELRGQLSERIPGAFNIAARAVGVTTSELNEMLDRGEVISEEFLPKFAAEMRRTFGDAATEAATGLQAAINRLTNAYDELLRTLADTGVIDGAGRVLTNLSNIVFNVATMFRRAKTAVVEFFDQFSDAPQTLTGLASRLEMLSRKIVKLSEQRVNSPFPEKLDEHIAELRAEYDRLQKTYNELSSTKTVQLPAIEVPGEVDTGPSAAFEKLRNELDKVKAATDQYNNRIALLQKELAAGNIDQAEFNKLAGLAKQQLDKVTSSANAAKGSLKGYAVELTALERAQAKFNDAIANYPARQAVRDLEEEFRAQEKVFTEGARLQEEAQDRVNRKLEESKQFVRDLGLTFSSSFEEAILKANSLSDVLRGLGQDILAITTRKLVTNPFAEAIGHIAGGLGGMFGGGAPASTAPHMFGPKVRFAHQGGIIGVDAMPMRSVSPSIFDNAPRLHNGGLLSGEIPAVLKRGEEILPANHPRHQNNQSTNGPTNITVQNHYNIDARGAGPGVSSEIRAALQMAEERSVARSEAKIMRSLTRGGAFAKATGRA